MNIEVVSRWYQPCEIPEFEEFAQPGDIIQMKRPAYSHYAIYIGRVTVDGKIGPAVIHRAIPASMRGSSITSCLTSISTSRSENASLTKANVILELLFDVIENCPFRINNSTDSDHKPHDHSEIVARAQEALLEVSPIGTYSVGSNNCEHFATWCRYGVKVSQQVANATTVATIGATFLSVLGVLGGALAVIGSIMIGRRRTN